MKQLPAPLAPWQRWLALFADDLAAPLGDLLLRLEPQLGSLRSAPAQADALPEGVGSIVRRGPYERLLMSEWMMADAEPDEFIRRAANNELLFIGPEPAARLRSRRCIALFDVGPGQLGEPRLLHLALFILLARRAGDAGAAFEWGVLQDAPQLHAGGDPAAMKQLLDTRRLHAATPDHVSAWELRLERNVDDVWVIGGHGLAMPAAMRTRVRARRNWLSEQLEVHLQTPTAARTVMLVLPAPAIGTRLLRMATLPLAPKSRIDYTKGRPALLQPPRFSPCGKWIAVALLDGGLAVHNVPQSLKTAPGKSRRLAPPASGNILGLALTGKAPGTVISHENMILLHGFPGDAAGGKNLAVTRPERGQFCAPPKLARWLPTFFLEVKSDRHVLVIDLERRLVAWNTRVEHDGERPRVVSTALTTIAANVIGAAQVNGVLRFAEAGAEHTVIKRWGSAAAVNAAPTLIPRAGTLALFGDTANWDAGHAYQLVALKCGPTEWWVGPRDNAFTLHVEETATVLGVARRQTEGAGLIVRSADKRSIELRSAKGRQVLITSPEDIAQASVNPANGAIAWIGGASFCVKVQGIDEVRPYLDVAFKDHDNVSNNAG